VININSKTVIKKYKNTLIIYFSITVIIITVMILVFLYVPNDNLVNAINILLLVSLIIFSLLYRNVILGFKNMSQVARVVLKQGEPIKYNSDIFLKKDYMENNQYEIFKSTSAYDIYYKYVSLKTYKFFKVKKLKTIVLIKENKLDYYDERLHEDINLLEENVAEKQRFYKHHMIFIKKFEKITKNDLKSIGEVVLYNVGRQSFIQINVGLNTEDKKAYFLYSDVYFPTMDFKDTTNEIKNIIG